MSRLLPALAVLLFALPAFADDWTGKTIKVKEDGLKLGRKLGGGLARDGAALDKSKTYTVKSDDGTYLELDGGFVFRSDAEVVADTKPFPKPLKADEKVKTDGWFGKQVLPKRYEEDIRMGDWVDGKQTTWSPHNLMNCTVREDRDGFLRMYDGRREGWVSKDDMVAAEDAPAYFDKAVKADERDAHAWNMRGNGWLRKGEYENAVKDFTEAIRLRPESSVYYNSRGNAWRAKKEYDKAIADYSEAIKLAPNEASDFYNRGLVWSDKKEYDKAIKDYDEALKLDPKYVKAFVQRGTARFHTKDYEIAVTDYTEAIRLDPKNSGAYEGRGCVYGIKKEYDKTLVDFNEAVRLDPKDSSYFANRGSVWRNKKEYDKAIADFTEALKLDPKNAYAYGNRAVTSAKVKKYDEAITGFEKALELNPMDWIHSQYAKFRASCLEAKYRDGKKAVELAKKAVEKAGKDATWKYADALAMAYAEAGDFELAVAEQRKAIELLKADKSADKDDIKKAEARLELYRAKKPYRDEE